METKAINTKLVKYFEESSKHLFATENNEFFKILLVKTKNKTLGLKMKFNGENMDINFYELDSIYADYEINKLCERGKYESAAKVVKHQWKHQKLFCSWEWKKHSIKNFKAMKEKMAEVEKFVQDTAELNMDYKQLGECIKKILADVKFKESEPEKVL